MKVLQCLKFLLQQNDFLCKIYLKDPYFVISLSKQSSKTEIQVVRQPLRVSLTLLWFLGPAPKVFTKLIRISVALFRRIIGVGAVWMKVFRFCSWVFYFKDYITRTQNLVQKIKFYRFWWLASENSKSQFFTQRLVKNRYYEIEPKVKYRFGISMWLSKQNIERISRNTSLKQNILPTS